MAFSISPSCDHVMGNTLSVQVPPPRRASRSSGSQPNPRSGRVEKPRSIHSSPRTLERRKTTSGPKRYATLDDHYNMMFGSAEDDDSETQERPEPSRPVSWHPSSSRFQVQFSPSLSTMRAEPTQEFTPGSSRNSIHGQEYYSLSARNSAIPEQTQSYFTSSSHRNSRDSASSWLDPLHPHSSSNSNTLSSYSTPATEPLPLYLQEYARKEQVERGSSDFLPIQHPASAPADAASHDEDMADTGKELVGMGLYDAPESSLLWESAEKEGTGKGLKLEETWQPPETAEEGGDEEEENEDEDDEDEDENEQHDEGDDASSEDGSVEDLCSAGGEELQIPVSIKPQLGGNMQGQSFFFDEDESYTKEWWYQPLKQPSIPVRDAGLGYGWL